MRIEDFRCARCDYTEAYEVEDNVDWSEITRAQAQEHYHFNCLNCGAFMYPVSMHISEPFQRRAAFLLFAGCRNAPFCMSYRSDCESPRLMPECLTELYRNIDLLIGRVEKVERLLSDLRNNKENTCS